MAAEEVSMKRSMTLLAAGFLLLVPAVPTRAGVIEEPDSNGSIQFKVGWFFPSGDSDLWRINESAFTQDHSDFNDGVIGFTYVAPMSTHVEIGFNVDLYESTVRSADRGFDGPVFRDGYLGFRLVRTLK